MEETNIPFDPKFIELPIAYHPNIGNVALPQLSTVIAEAFGKDQLEAIDALMCNDAERMAAAKKKMDQWQAWAQAAPIDDDVIDDEDY